MDAIKMQLESELRINNLTQVNVGTFMHSTVIESFLNKAQDLTTRKYIELYDKEPQARIYLGRLIEGVKLTTGNVMTATDATRTGAVMFNVPASLWWPVFEQVKLTHTATSTVKLARVKEVTGTHAELNWENPFKKPYEDMVWRTETGRVAATGGFKVFQLMIPTGYTFLEYILDYVKHPADIVISSNTATVLDEGVHNELVDLAVELIIDTYNLRKQPNK